MPSSEQHHIQEALQKLRQKLRSKVPFRHSSEFHDEKNIKDVGDRESRVLWYAFTQMLKSRNDLSLQAIEDLARELRIQLEKEVEACLTKNSDHKTAWASFLEKDVEHILEKFKWTCEVKLLVQHPETDMKSAQQIVQEATLVACRYFEENSNHGNADLYGQLNATLMQKLDLVGKEVLANHSSCRLEDKAVEEARNALEEVKSIVSGMLSQLKLEVRDLERKVSQLITLKEKAKDLENFLKDKGFKLLNGPYPRVHSHLVEDVESAMQTLGNEGEEGNMGLEDAIAWTERLDKQLNDRFNSAEQSNENEGSWETMVAGGKRNHQLYRNYEEGDQGISASEQARMSKTQTKTMTVVDECFRDSTSVSSALPASDTNGNLMAYPGIPVDDSSLSGKEADSVLRMKLNEKLEHLDTEHLEMRQSYLTQRVPPEAAKNSFCQDGVDISMSVTAGPYFQQLIKDESEEDALESELERNSEVVSAPSSVRSSARLALKKAGNIARNFGENVAVLVDAPLRSRIGGKLTKKEPTHGSSAAVVEMTSASPSIPPSPRQTQKAVQITVEGGNLMCDRAGAESFSLENEPETETHAESSELEQYHNQQNMILGEFPIVSSGVQTAEAIIQEVGDKQIKSLKKGEFSEKDKAVLDAEPGVKQSPQVYQQLFEDVENGVRILDKDGDEEIVSLENATALSERLDEELNDRFKSAELLNKDEESAIIMVAGGKRNHQHHGNDLEGDQGVSASKQAKPSGTQTRVSDKCFRNSTSASSVPLVSGSSENLMADPVIQIESSSFSAQEARSVPSVPGEKRKFRFLRAILKGKKVAFIQEMLDGGANVNIKNKYGYNAAHAAIQSLMDGKRTTEGAIAILNLLVAKGFNLLNDVGFGGSTPLIRAMRYEGLNEELLSWFSQNGADFNAVEKNFMNSVVIESVQQGQRPEIIRKILDFGGDPMYVNKWKANALHVAARSGHHSALEIFVDILNINARNKFDKTPLHLLFKRNSGDYQNCLEFLLKKGADFSASSRGYIPLVYWIKDAYWYSRNPFPALNNLKDMLPITEDIASSTLTAVVARIGELGLAGNHFLFVNGRNGSASQFIRFLIEEKKARLLLKDEGKSTKRKKRTKQNWTKGKEKDTYTRCDWNTQRWNKLLKGMLTSKFFEKLKQSVSGMESADQRFLIRARHVGVLEFHAESNILDVRIEIVLNCLLACENYEGFNRICMEMLRGLLRELKIVSKK